ncbi:MAG: hypothetical protein CL908_04880 [Deltaproteobacteria bacterium]|nr:hypothetical protein [Deltaproteobacteria bacterium]
MIPILLVLLFGAGLVAGLVLALGALVRHLRRPTLPTSTKVVTGAFGAAGLGVASLAGGLVFFANPKTASRHQSSWL